jgi:lysophospholipase L1-like esterase
MTQRVIDLAARCGKLAPVVRRPKLVSCLAAVALASVATTCARGPAAAPPRQLASIAPADPRSSATPSSSAAAPAESAAAPTPPAPAVSNLEGASHLEGIFRALAALEDGKSRDVVHILQYGDSHTATDMGVAVFRRALQARFGDAGRGFVPIGRPWKGYWQGGLRLGMSRDFKSARFKATGGTGDANGDFGLLGVGIETTAADALAWTEPGVRFSHVEVDFWRQPRGGSFDVLVDDVKAARVVTRASTDGSGFLGLDVPEAPHKVTVRTLGNGPVRVFGMTLDRPGGGVVVDALGIVGAQISTPLRWQESHFDEQVGRRTPRLVILAYGTNEAVDTMLTDADYERGLRDLVARVGRAASGASCLLLGPPDLARKNEDTGEWMTVPRLLAIVAVQRRVAGEAGCAFYDQLAAMGGAGSMALWAGEAEPRAMKDRTHLKPSGYAQVATSFVSDLLNAYDEWRSTAEAPAVASSP